MTEKFLAAEKLEFSRLFNRRNEYAQSDQSQKRCRENRIWRDETLFYCADFETSAGKYILLPISPTQRVVSVQFFRAIDQHNVFNKKIAQNGLSAQKH